MTSNEVHFPGFRYLIQFGAFMYGIYEFHRLAMTFGIQYWVVAEVYAVLAAAAMAGTSIAVIVRNIHNESISIWQFGRQYLNGSLTCFAILGLGAMLIALCTYVMTDFWNLDFGILIVSGAVIGEFMYRLHKSKAPKTDSKATKNPQIN